MEFPAHEPFPTKTAHRNNPIKHFNHGFGAHPEQKDSPSVPTAHQHLPQSKCWLTESFLQFCLHAKSAKQKLFYPLPNILKGRCLQWILTRRSLRKYTISTWTSTA
jgi:hypothetical protein